MEYYVYIITNKNNTVLYTGVTNDLRRRLYEHRFIHTDSFSSRYKTTKLVYFEQTNDIRVAIEREKQIKGWTRNKKNELIESLNPRWEDLPTD
jgi:putative endonuclease